MKPAPFDMHRPEQIEEALDLLARHAGIAKVIAGGQSLVPLMNLRMATPGVLVDLGRIRSLRAIGLHEGGLLIGAMSRQAECLASPLVASRAPLLRQTLENIGHVQTRARGTIGGSLAHADPAAELPVAMVAADATFSVRSARGSRRIKAREFFKGALETALGEDEILEHIVIPPAIGARTYFKEYARRHGDFAIVSVAILCSGKRQAPGSLAIALGGLMATPHLCTGLMAATSAGVDGASIQSLVETELAALTAMSDIHASGEYRKHLAAVLLADGLTEVLKP